MEETIVAEQHEDDAYIHDLQEECFETIQTLTTEINVADTRAEQLQELLDEWIPLRNRKNIQLKDTNQFISDLQDSILELNKEKAEKDEEWAQTQDDHSYAVRVITAAKNIIQGGLTSFIETKIPMKGVFA